jgi:hypothetical protein
MRQNQHTVRVAVRWSDLPVFGVERISEALSASEPHFGPQALIWSFSLSSLNFLPRIRGNNHPWNQAVLHIDKLQYQP